MRSGQAAAQVGEHGRGPYAQVVVRRPTQRLTQVVAEHRDDVAERRVGHLRQRARRQALGRERQGRQGRQVPTDRLPDPSQPRGVQVAQAVGDVLDDAGQRVVVEVCRALHAGTLPGVASDRRVPQDARLEQTQLIPRVGTGTGTGGLPPLAPPPTRAAPRRRRPVLRVVVGLLALLVGYVGVLVGAVLLGLERVDLATGGERPPPGPGQTWLLVGSDSRADLTEAEQAELSTGGGDARLTDTILMLTTAPDGVATLISIPRDSLVEIPGYGQNKINAAYAFGGPALLVQTVEQATGVHVDGYVEVGFDGFYRIVEAVGGVEVCLEQPMADERAGIDLPAGCQVLGGADALGYVRARYSDPRGDLGRVERQREFLQALAQRATSPAVLLNPLRSVPLAVATGQALTVDTGMGPVDLGRFSLAMLRSTGPGGQMLTVPIGGDATTDVGSVLLWDSEKAPALWAAVRDGTPVPALE